MTNPYRCRNWEVIEVSMVNGTIEPPQETNLFCKFKITVAPNKKILAKFDFIRTEENLDFVSVYDGPSGSAPFLYRYSGEHNPTPFMSSGNHLYITYSTDSSLTYQGFRLKFYSIDTDCMYNILNPSII